MKKYFFATICLLLISVGLCAAAIPQNKENIDSMSEINKLRNIQQRHRTGKGSREGHCLCSPNNPLNIACPGNHSRHFAWDFEKEYFNGNAAKKQA